MKADRQQLRMAFKRLERELPPRFAATLRWLRHPASHLARWLAAVVLVVGGVFSFLPVLGLWMLPLGLMLIAADVPFLRRPMARFAHWSVDRFERIRGRRGPQDGR